MAPASALFLLVPLNLLAAQAISDLAGRRVPVRTLTGSPRRRPSAVAWWVSANLQRRWSSTSSHGRADSATALGLHLALDLLVAAVWLTRRLDRWARRRDDRQRRVLAGFLAAVLAVTVGGRLPRGLLPPQRDRRPADAPDDDPPPQPRAAVRRWSPSSAPRRRARRPTAPSPAAGSGSSSARPCPHLPQRDLATTDDLLALPDGQRLVILAGTDQRLSYAAQSRLGLEAIHPGRSGVLDAFATATVD